MKHIDFWRPRENCSYSFCLLYQFSNANSFKVMYTDSSGVKWGSRGPTNLANGCTNPEGDFSEADCTFERRNNGEPITYDTYYEVERQGSRAADYCNSLGARLPRVGDYLNLIRDFEHTDLQTRPFPFLTDNGRSELLKVFPDMKNSDNYFYPFWTSSILKDSFWGSPIVSFAYIFSSSEGSLTSIGRSKDHGVGVRCVQD